MIDLTCHLRRALKAFNLEVSILAIGHGEAAESCTDTLLKVWE